MATIPPSSKYPETGYVAPPGCAALNDAVEDFHFVIRIYWDDTTNVARAVRLKDDFLGKFESVQPYSRVDHDVVLHYVDKEHSPWHLVIFCKTCDKNVSANFLKKTITEQRKSSFLFLICIFDAFLFAPLSFI